MANKKTDDEKTKKDELAKSKKKAAEKKEVSKKKTATKKNAVDEKKNVVEEKVDSQPVKKEEPQKLQLNCPTCDSEQWVVREESTDDDPRFGQVKTELRQCSICKRRFKIVKIGNSERYLD